MDVTKLTREDLEDKVDEYRALLEGSREAILKLWEGDMSHDDILFVDELGHKIDAELGL